MRWAVVLGLVIAAGGGVLLVARSSGSHDVARQPLRITRLSGVRFERNGLRWVRLRATLCDPSPPAGGDFPSAVIVTHFAIPKHASRWFAMRTAIDHPSYIVPFQESWDRSRDGSSTQTRCGPVSFEDPLTSAHGYDDPLAYGACYGASLTIVTQEHRRATRRVVVSCKPGWS